MMNQNRDHPKARNDVPGIENHTLDNLNQPRANANHGLFTGDNFLCGKNVRFALFSAISDISVHPEVFFSTFE